MEHTEFQRQTGIQWNDGQRTVGTVQYDTGMNALFFTQPVENAVESKRHGRKFCINKDFVRIAPPGEKLNIVVREATEFDKQRFPVQWAAYQQKKMQVPDGTPIDLLFPADPAATENMRACGVFTVEQLANLSSEGMMGIGMGGQTFVTKAKTYLEQANRGVTYHKFQKELEDRDGQIRVLKQTIDMMQQEMAHIRNMSNMMTQNTQMAYAQSQGRPQYPQQHMGQFVPPGFDAQTAQIAAVGAETRGAPQYGEPMRLTPEAPPPMYVAPAAEPQPISEQFVSEQQAKPWVEPRRRGRPPGAKNKPKPEAA